MVFGPLLLFLGGTPFCWCARVQCLVVLCSNFWTGCRSLSCSHKRCHVLLFFVQWIHGTAPKWVSCRQKSAYGQDMHKRESGWIAFQHPGLHHRDQCPCIL